MIYRTSKKINFLNLELGRYCKKCTEFLINCEKCYDNETNIKCL